MDLIITYMNRSSVYAFAVIIIDIKGWWEMKNYWLIIMSRCTGKIGSAVGNNSSKII